MKKTLLLLTLIVISIANAQYFEGFEKGVPGTMIQKGEEGETIFIDFSIAAVGVENPLSDENSAVFWNGMATKQVTSTLQTPLLNLLDNNFILEFKYLQRPMTKNYYNQLVVELSNDFGATWQNVTTCNRTSAEIQNISIDLNPFKTSSNSIIRFKTTQFKADLGYPIVIDDIDIHKKITYKEQQTTITSSIDKNIIYPNPSSGVFTVKLLNTANIIVIDFQGKIILEQKNIDNEITINLSNYPKGTYLVELTNNNTTEVQKIILK